MIEEDDLGARRRGHGLFPRVHVANLLIAIELQQMPDQLGHRGVVLDHEDAAGRGVGFGNEARFAGT